CTFKAFPDEYTQAWNVGVIVPRSFYLAQLERIRYRVLWASVALIAAIVAIGGLILHSIGKAHSVVVSEASRMNAFEFSPSKNSSRLRDIGDVLASLEKAKTAMRAMGKYVPVDLVKRLYHVGREPALGGECTDLSVLFTDIRGFTSFAERHDPDKVAEILGRYLQVVAAAVQGEKGTIDKFIGDAVMAFWNAPEEVPGHALLACRAALHSRSSLKALYDSPEWGDTPRFETRYGLHRCSAYVGHFGAPDRFNYTAIGDGINLASRLEGLNKHYGTAIIASEDIYQAAKESFEFRLLDRVAVKGKAQGVTIYELLGEKAPGASLRSPAIEKYEKAFGEFQRGDFRAALALIENESQDAPSLVLAARCRDFIGHPPAPGWDGLHVFETK
ncbi:MAG TPA: adenylate/guanylate cyclase domain-containing protein, partial [Chthoniobacteraceae bacterium]|nr:adenylate/guanylate cyclase domain-containing protein [Chthoniobacteraceae bacterium]